ncbi:MAG: hypothetical protein AAF267_21265 [Deinococcota bacterium]
MKAFVNTVYGPPDVLKLTDVTRPQPQANEVLVKIHAASVNPWDWHNMRGEPFPVRFSNGILKPTYGTLGADIAGIVEAHRQTPGRGPRCECRRPSHRACQR